jgi:hypothetical protein
LAAHDQQRLTAWKQSLEAMTGALREDLQQSSHQASNLQREICATLAQTAGELSTQTQAQARDTIAEVARLVQTAAQAPMAATEVITELRQKLADSISRDSVMLEQHTRLTSTLASLLDSVSHTSTEQRSAIDALVTSSAELQERISARFGEQIASETGKLDTAAAQLTASAAEVASLGDAFAASIQLFGKTNDKLALRLQRIEGALDKSLTRSDEQLAYYVAQAREVVDLSVLAQRQIIEELQQLGAPRALPGAEPA